MKTFVSGWQCAEKLVQIYMCVFLQVGDIISIIDMPPGEETAWWRGKNQYQVKCIQTLQTQTPEKISFVVKTVN